MPKVTYTLDATEASQVLANHAAVKHDLAKGTPVQVTYHFGTEGLESVPALLVLANGFARDVHADSSHPGGEFGRAAKSGQALQNAQQDCLL